MTSVSNTVTPISKRELLAYQADIKGAIFRQIRETFSRLKQTGFTQKDLAIKIGMNEGQLSRRLRGDYDLRLETLSDLARGLDCRIHVVLMPISSSSVLASDRAAPDAVGKSVEFRDASTSEKYDTGHRLKKHHGTISSKGSKVRERKNFSFVQAKPFARRRKERMALSDMRSFGKKPATQIRSPGTKSPLGRAKLHALYKKVI